MRVLGLVALVKELLTKFGIFFGKEGAEPRGTVKGGDQSDGPVGGY
jgi:hypothetical protein